MRILRQFVVLSFCLSPLAFAAEADVLPDDVEVRLTKKGAAPAVIVIDVAGAKTTLNEGEWEKLPAEAKNYVEQLFAPGKSGRIAISLDVSEAPEAKEWGEKAVQEAERWFPILVGMLDSEGFQPTKTAIIAFKKMDGVAHASHNRITISVDWITRHPDDIGMVIHELVHIIQAYRSRVPGWVTEGIADYLRFFVYERNGDKTCRVNPDRAKYTDSYRTTAAFFDWIVRTKNKDLIKKLNAECRAGRYSDDIFPTLTNQSLDELWANFIESLRKERRP